MPRAGEPGAGVRCLGIDVMRRLKWLAMAGAVVLALHGGPAWAQAQPPVKGPGAFKGTFDSYKSELGPAASTASCPGDTVEHNNAGAKAEGGFEVAPSNTILSAGLQGPSTGAAHNGNYLNDGSFPGRNPFGVGTAKFGSSSGLIADKRHSATAGDGGTINAPCKQTAEGTLN